MGSEHWIGTFCTTGAATGRRGRFEARHSRNPQASVGTEASGAVSVLRLTSGPHVVVENIVGQLRAAHLARIDVESVVNATPDAAVRLVIAELKEAHVRLRVHDRVASVKDNGSVPPLPTFASPPMSSSAAAVGLEPLYDPQGLRLLA